MKLRLKIFRGFAPDGSLVYYLVNYESVSDSHGKVCSTYRQKAAALEKSGRANSFK